MDEEDIKFDKILKRMKTTLYDKLKVSNLSSDGILSLMKAVDILKEIEHPDWVANSYLKK